MTRRGTRRGSTRRASLRTTRTLECSPFAPAIVATIETTVPKRRVTRRPWCHASDSIASDRRDPEERPRARVAQTQSPAIITGLHRFATLPWLHFVASPRRMPALGRRLQGRAVVYFIDTLPPLLLPSGVGALSRKRAANANSRYTVALPFPGAAVAAASTDGGSTGSHYSDYADPGRVSSAADTRRNRASRASRTPPCSRSRCRSRSRPCGSAPCCRTRDISSRAAS
jgi:hypothetical protein